MGRHRDSGAYLITATFENVAQTGSTNEDLLRRLNIGERIFDGHWLIADQQTAGRGRQGRVWDSAAGNLYASTVVTVRAGDPAAHTLALVIGCALIDALHHVAPDVPAALKWPNDVLVDGAKLAGILLERQGDAVVVGVGVNVRHAPDVVGRDTTALADHEVECSRDRLAVQLADCTASAVAIWRGSNGLAMIRDRWLARAHPIGTPLHIQGGSEGGLTGRFDGLETDGRLRLRGLDGDVALISAGDVSIVP